MINKPRRTLLKGLACGSAMSLGGLSSLAIAKSNGQSSSIDTELLSGDIHLLPTQNNQTKTLSLFNHSDSSISIGRIDQIATRNEQGFLAIQMGDTGQDSVMLAPGESRAFKVAMADVTNPAEISNHYQTSNKVLPVTVFDTQAA